MAGFGKATEGITPYLLFLIATATVGTLQYGFHLAELNAPEDVMTCRRKSIFGDPDKPNDPANCIPMSKAVFGVVTSIFTLGGLIGALYSGPLSSRRGRRPTLILTAGVYAIGSAIEALAPAVWVLCIGRVISGIGAGAATVVVPLYISEVAPPAQRGFFGVMTQVSINIGILIAQSLGYFLSSDGWWKIILVVGGALGLAQGLGCFFMPETPAWLALNGNGARAHVVLKKIRGKGADISLETREWNVDNSAPDEQDRLLATTDNDSRVSALSSSPAHLGFLDVAKDHRSRPAIIAVVGIMAAQQFCGINSIIMYSVSLLKGLLPIHAALLTVIISAANLVTTVACSPLPDRIGRKTCLLISTIGQGSSSLVLAVSIIYHIKWLSAVSVLFFVAFFAVGLGPVPFILAAELVDTEAVGATQSWCLASNWIATFVVTLLFPIINTQLKKATHGDGHVYFIFAGLAALSAVFIFWRVPETKGKRSANEVWGREHRNA
ncbi:general substrate transporter [Emericellopsis atlantica]|uniref:General substrate transporter n=1 Tax=Emericellopsis atlantica TaxID=2614577 RepID=A0A9P7ZP58_9HYPO|nr:general substrate transporter [Emericellopsis atlantica]KAG9255714.1 general substrate transporter [Emericellopsis atlantica]